MKQVIKKSKDKNQYLLTPNKYWIRDFKQRCVPIDINNFNFKDDVKLITNNSEFILSKLIPEIGSEQLPRFDNIAIVSDGYDFNNAKSVLNQLSQKVKIIGTNGSLSKWDVDDKGVTKRAMDFYFVNNPYGQCVSNLPKHNYHPRCICSIRTNRGFISRYRGQLFYYNPTPTKQFGKKIGVGKSIDDYRNPICGALSLSMLCKARRILLFCCDNAFKDKRPGAEKLPNGLWIYPQHKIVNEIIDGILYWAKLTREEDISSDFDLNNDLQIMHYSHGPEYKNVNYIELEDIKGFFND